jgi:centrosomal protein CEP250
LFLFSLTLSLVEKEQRLIVLQEADCVQQQELNSLRQDMQKAQEGQKELSAQVLPSVAMVHAS